MPTGPQPPTLAQVAHRAAEVADPAGGDPLVADLYARFEDRDEPVTAIAAVESTVAEERTRAEFDGHPPPAVADWLAAQGVEL